MERSCWNGVIACEGGMEPISFRPAGSQGGTVKIVPIIEAIKILEKNTPYYSRRVPGERIRAREKMVKTICRMHDAGHSPSIIRRSVGLTMAEIVAILKKHRPESPDPAEEETFD